jgi:8-oxo-dGTP pyrophosphatase MutT (NUDIX family)
MKKMFSAWLGLPFLPPEELITQVSGVCFTHSGTIILVNDGKNWQLPGGSPEKKEMLSDTLIREIAEEACLKVLDYEYIGSIKCEYLTPVTGGDKPLFYKTRFWVSVKKQKFDPRFEIYERIEIRPDQFVSMLGWNARKTAGELLNDALLMQGKKVSSNNKRKKSDETA